MSSGYSTRTHIHSNFNSLDPEQRRQQLQARVRAACEVFFDNKGSRMAEEIGVSQATVSRILRGVPSTSRPYERVIEAIESHLDADDLEEELTNREREVELFHAGEDFRTEGEVVQENFEEATESPLPEKIAQGVQNTHPVTFYFSRPNAGNSGSIAGEDGVTVQIQRLLLRQVLGGSIPLGLGMMLLDGDSMEPEVRDGSVVFFAPVEDVPDAGRYVLSIDGRLYLKKVQRMSGGVYRVFPANDDYDAETFQSKGDVVESLETGATVHFRVVGKYKASIHPSDFQYDLTAQQIVNTLSKHDLVQAPSQQQ